MDDPNRRRRQNEPPVHPTSTPRYPVPEPSQQRRSLAGGDERYRPAPLSTSPSAARGMGGAGSYSNYYQEPSASFSAANMPAAAMAYGPEYGQDSRQQTQSFGGYNATATMMYNVPQPGTQTPVYDAQQFGSRQPATMQLMTPDVTTQYFGSEAGGAGASSLQQPNPNSSAPANVYQQSNHMNYGGSIPNVSSVQQSTASTDVAMPEDQDYADSGALEEKWVNYQRQLGTVFQEIHHGNLEGASETLLSISSWLLTQVVDLGLNLDDASLHSDRIKLWNDFNHAWLALGQKQREMMESGQQPRGQSLMSKATVKKMGNELVRLCDGIERHGLVDYQYGVWEERITEILEVCLDLYEPSQNTSGGSESR